MKKLLLTLILVFSTIQVSLASEITDTCRTDIDRTNYTAITSTIQEVVLNIGDALHKKIINKDYDYQISYFGKVIELLDNIENNISLLTPSKKQILGLLKQQVECKLGYIENISLTTNIGGELEEKILDIPIMNIHKRSDRIDIRDMGANGEDSIDDTESIQKALDLLKTDSSKSGVYFPEGEFLISKTLIIGGPIYGKTISGHGRNTIIKWTGTTSDPMLYSIGATNISYVGLSWDGNNIASIGIWHHSTTVYETFIEHKYESFRNFTQAGIESYGGDQNTTLSTAEIWVDNCLFDNTHYGLNIGTNEYNDYDWVIDNCEIRNNVIGVRAVKGQIFIYNTHFYKSSEVDILAQNSGWFRRVTSEGSFMFYKDVSNTSSGQKSTFQDIHVDNWTNPSGVSIDYGYRGAMMLFDSSFTNSPNTLVYPVKLRGTSGSGWGEQVTTSNNYWDSGLDVLDRTKNATFIDIAKTTKGGVINDASTTFIDSTTITEGPLVEVTDMNILQDSIDKAGIANNGTIIYMPFQESKYTYYNFDKTINLSGSNYTIEGAGPRAFYKFINGDNSSVFFNMNNANNVEIKKMTFELNNGETAILQDTDGDNIYDRLQTKDARINTDKTLIKLKNLTSKSNVLLKYNRGRVDIIDSGNSLIFSKMHLNNLFISGLKGSGFFAFRWLNVMNITVNDSNDLTVGDFYTEQSPRIFDFKGNNYDSSGRITFGGMQKVHSWTDVDPEYMFIDNYKGDVCFMQGNFVKYETGDSSSKIWFRQNENSLNSLNFILVGDGFTNRVYNPSYNIDIYKGNSYILQSTVVSDSQGNKYDISNSELTEDLESKIGNSLDDMRKLGEYDLLLK